jgi:transcriptional regulator with XRE-family HTH domain
MTARGIEFMHDWLTKNITPVVKLSLHGDAASMSVEMAERLIADAAKAGIALSELEPEFGQPEVIIRETLEGRRAIEALSLGESIRANRMRLNLTQGELALKLACTKTAVSKWEANKSIPHVSRFNALAEALGLMPEILFESVGHSKRPATMEFVDTLLLSAWQKLAPAQRETLVRIAIVLSQA